MPSLSGDIVAPEYALSFTGRQTADRPNIGEAQFFKRGAWVFIDGSLKFDTRGPALKDIACYFEAFLSGVNYFFSF